MADLILQLDPTKLANPDVDLRYRLPELLNIGTGGQLQDDGYDYVVDDGVTYLLVFLHTENLDAVLPKVLEFLTTQQVLGNDLFTTAVAIDDGAEIRVVHPAGFGGKFHFRPAH